MTYEEALAYLHGLRRFGMKPGLSRTVALLERMGRPDRRLGRVIHITGTSGKGSVAALVESALRAAGYRTGLYTSPSLERFTERIQINRNEIPPQRFADLIAQVAPQAEAMAAEGLEPPTEWEVLTVAAFLYYASEGLDWLVLEVGLGGRFDATTAVEDPVLTCITNIGLDHMEWLGSTHEQIAWDKAGIIKPAVPCVTGTDHPGALQVIREVAMAHDAVLIEVSADQAQVRDYGPEGQTLDLLGARGWYRAVRLALLGIHQAHNAAVALRVLELAGMDEAAVRAGFANVRWPGRFEILPGRPTVVLDAAHNPAKCAALASALRDYFPGRRFTLVLGMLADKQVDEMVRPLLPLAHRVFCVAPDNPRAMAAEGLAEICSSEGWSGATAASGLESGLDEALAAAGPDGVVVVTGSFYTIGPARRHLQNSGGRD